MRKIDSVHSGFIQYKDAILVYEYPLWEKDDLRTVSPMGFPILTRKRLYIESEP